MLQIELKPWIPEYANQLVKIANNPNIAQYMTDRFASPYKLESAKIFIEFATNSQEADIQSVWYKDQLAGSIGLHKQGDIFCKNMEIGYWLGEDFWGKGIATHIVNKWIEHGFNTYDITRIFARIFGNNSRSASVAKACGMTLESEIKNNLFKNGQFLDEWIFAIRK